MVLSVIAVKNWSRYQHYADRDPTWIKLYRDVLTTEAWVLGNDISRLLQIAITLLAARYQNAVPNNFALIKKVASLDFSEQQYKKAFEHLLGLNFLEIQGVEQTASTALAPCYAREEKAREEIQDKTESKNQDMSSKLDPVDQVFEHWKSVWKHPRSALDLKRSAAIKRALKGYSVADLCESISGYLNSTHHCGINDRNTVYDGLHLLLRDSDHIDAGLRFFRSPPELSSKLTQHNVAILQKFIPSELRNETPGFEQVSSGDGGPERDIRQGTLPAPH